MTDTDEAGRLLPSPKAPPLIDTPAAPDATSGSVRKNAASTREMFGRGFLLIVGEMFQLVLAFLLALFAIACCAALAVKANDTIHFMGDQFVTPRSVRNMLGGLPGHDTTFLIICLLAAIFGIKLLDLVIRVLRRRARLAELGYSAAQAQSASMSLHR